jgi:hypothetical protein
MADIVEQVDRDSAWPHRPEPYRYRLGRESVTKTKRDWMHGVYDNLPHIQSYVRHRLAERTRLFTLLREHAADEDVVEAAWKTAEGDCGGHDGLDPTEAFLAILDTLERKL